MSIVYPFVQVPLAQIIWYHHISMFPKVKDNILCAFYIPNNFADTLPPLKLPFMNSCNMHIIPNVIMPFWILNNIVGWDMIGRD